MTSMQAFNTVTLHVDWETRTAELMYGPDVTEEDHHLALAWLTEHGAREQWLKHSGMDCADDVLQIRWDEQHHDSDVECAECSAHAEYAREIAADVALENDEDDEMTDEEYRAFMDSIPIKGRD